MFKNQDWNYQCFNLCVDKYEQFLTESQKDCLKNCIDNNKESKNILNKLK